MKTYPSKEINLLEWIKQTQSFDVNSWFEWSSETDSKADHWNAMLLAINKMIFFVANAEPPIFEADLDVVRTKIRKSNALLKVLLPVVNDSGIINESNHAHSIYFTGLLPIDIKVNEKEWEYFLL